MVDGRSTPIERLQPRLERNPEMGDVEFAALVNESARYNIGRVRRNVNVPTFALIMLRASEQSRFSFEKREERRLAGILTWALLFEERAQPTLIRGSGGADLPATGIISVDPSSGRVIETQFSTEEPSTQVRTQITVKYRPNQKLGTWVPIEMREHYQVRAAGSFAEQNIDCVATYSNFRRFKVDVKVRVPQGVD